MDAAHREPKRPSSEPLGKYVLLFAVIADDPRPRSIGFIWPETKTANITTARKTSGEQRLSDFLLWESAYAELYFTERTWPDFTETDLAEAVKIFHSRQRNFGGLPAARNAA